MAFSHNAGIQELRFNPVDDSQFAAVDKYGELRIWNTDSSSPQRTVKVESIYTGKLKCLAWSHDGKYLSVGSGIGDAGIIYTFDTSSWSKSAFDLPGLGDVNSLDYNNDSLRLAIGHDNGLIVCNTDTYGIEYYSTDPVHHVRWSPDGSMLAAGGQIYVFDHFNFNGPKIQISTPQSKSSYTSSLVEIAGKISGLHGIRSATVSVNGGAPAALSLAPDGFFARTVSLADGQNQILIQAQDRTKNRSSYIMVVNRLADLAPPVLTQPYVDAGVGIKGTKFKFSVRAYDANSGVDTSKVTAGIRLPDGNKLVTVQLYDDGSHGDENPDDGVFGNTWDSSKAGEGLHSVDFFAFDDAGNSADLDNGVKLFVYDRPVIKEPYLSTKKPLSSEQVTVNTDITDISGVQSADLLYSIDAGNSWSLVPMPSTGLDYSGTIPAQKTGTVYYKVKARDVHGYWSETNAYAYRVHDGTKPVVIIRKPATVEESFTSEPSIIVAGQTIDAGGLGLQSVTCNTGARNTGALKEWSFRVSLKRGINNITIVAESQNGKLASDSIKITYAPQLTAPVFSPAAPHVFEDRVSVVISSSNKEATVHYTTDNLEPTDASPGFTSPIFITETTTIKARAFQPDCTPSVTVIGSYTLMKQAKIKIADQKSTSEKTVPKEKTKDSVEKTMVTKLPSKDKTATSNKKSEPNKSMAIQVAAFKDKKFADELVERFKNKGYSAYTVSGKSPGKATWYKVRIGLFNDRAEAQSTVNKLEKYKKKAIIIVNETADSAKKKEASVTKVKEDRKPKPPAPVVTVPKEAPSAPGKEKAVSLPQKQVSKPQVKEGSVTEKPKELLASKGETLVQQDREERLKSFLRIYCRTYESKDIDKFAAFFAPDAVENNTPFQDMLPKYRKNMEKIESFSYRIELGAYSLQIDTGNVKIQGKYFTRYLLHKGTWQESSGSISMELTESGDSFLVKRLNYSSR